MAYIKHFLLMLRFMTTIPVNVNIMAEREDYGKSLATAPLVGLVIGLLMAGAHYVLSLVLPPAVSAVFTFAVYIHLTGGLHLDGLGDTADGLFSNRPKERMLEIMKDSRVGTNAVITLILIILLNISLISALEESAAVILILVPVAGRTGSLIGAGISSYAGISDGPGRWCVEYCRGRDIAKGLITQCLIFISVFAVSFFSTGIIGIGTEAIVQALSLFPGQTISLSAGWLAASYPVAQAMSLTTGQAMSSPAGLPIGLLLLVTAIPPFSALALTKLLGRKLSGVTGDILGAVCELNQVIFLLSALILFKIF